MVHLNSLSSAAFESARVGRAVKSNLVFVPDDIQIEDGKLVWKLPAQTTRENWVEPKDLMLIRFCKLHEKSSDQDILKFARRYGVFGAAELNTDAPRFDNELPHAGKRWKVSTEWSTPIGEPLSLWRGLSARYDATLRLAADLAQRPPKVGLAKYWQYLCEQPKPLPDIEDAQFIICIEVNEWLKIGRVGLSLQTKGWSRLRTEWESEVIFRGTYNLLGALAVQLMLTVADATLHSCSHCGAPIMSGRFPKRNQRNYCDDCRAERWPLKDADRDRKERITEAQKLYEQGVSIGNIQQQLGIRQLKTVRTYLKGKQNGKTKTRKR
jgi:transposase-like protein